MRLAPLFAVLSLALGLGLAGCSLPSLEERASSQAVAADATQSSRLGKAVQQLRSAHAQGQDGALTGIHTLADPREAFAARALLAENDSNAALALSGDLLVTGPTRTNVMDLAVLLVERP